MEALIFAAGLGTRLGEAGRRLPKALIDVGGRTMLERVSARLVGAGVDRIVVNVHHHAELIERFVETHDLGAEVVLSHERERPLETGGALLHARGLLRADEPFFLHNVDVLTDADLGALHEAHLQAGGLATMAVQERPTPRRLLFDDHGLYGRLDERRSFRVEVREPRGKTREWAFAGVHVASPGLLERITETGVFPILDLYLRLAATDGRVVAASIGEARWLEIGTPERLEAARDAVRAGR